MKVIGIAGGSGSGKSTICQMLRESIAQPSALLSHDNYYRCLRGLPEEQRRAVNFDHPDALETELLCQHIDELRQGVAIEMPTYCFSSHTRNSSFQEVLPSPFIFVDGVLLLMGADLRARLDFTVYVQADAETRLARRIARDTADRGRTRESVIDQWNASVLPMHKLFVEPSRQYADCEVDNSTAQVDLNDLVAMLRE